MHFFRWIVQIGDITLVWNIWRITVLHHNHQIVMWHLMLVWNIWSSSLEFEIKVEDVTSDSRDGQADLSVRCGRNWQELDRGHSFYSSLTIFVRNIFKFNHFWRYFHLGPYSLFNVHWYRLEDVLLTEDRSETSILRIKCIGEKYLKGQL